MPQRPEAPEQTQIGSLQPLQTEAPLVPNVLMSTQALQNLAVTLLETPGTPKEREIMRLQALNILKFSMQEDPLRQIPAGTRVEEVRENGDGQVRVTVIYQAGETATREPLALTAPSAQPEAAPKTLRRNPKSRPVAKQAENRDGVEWVTARELADELDINFATLKSRLKKAGVATNGLATSARRFRKDQAMAIAAEMPVLVNTKAAVTHETAAATPQVVEQPANPQLVIETVEQQPVASEAQPKEEYRPLKEIIEEMGATQHFKDLRHLIYQARHNHEIGSRGEGAKTLWNVQQAKAFIAEFLDIRKQGAEASIPLPANPITDATIPVVSEISTLVAPETPSQAAAPATQPVEQPATPQPIAKAVEAPETNRVAKQPVAGEVKPKEEYLPLKEIIDSMGATPNYHILRTQIYSARDKGEIESKKAGVNTLWNVQQVRAFIEEFLEKRKQDAEVSGGNNPLSLDPSASTTDSPATKERKPIKLEEAREKMRRILERRSADPAPNEPQFIGLEEAATRYNVDLTDLRFAMRERMRGDGINPEDCEGTIDGQIDVQTTRFPICLIDTLAASLPKAQAA